MSKSRRGTRSRSLPRVANVQSGISVVQAAPAMHIKNKTMGDPNGFNLGDQISHQGLPKQIVFELNNATGAAIDYILFDSMGLIQSLIGAPGADSICKKASHAIVKQFIIGNPLAFNAMRIQVTTSEAQFANEMTFHQAQIDNTLESAPLPLDGALNANQLNQKVQNYKVSMIMASNRGLSYTVDAGEKAIITFYVNADYNKI